MAGLRGSEQSWVLLLEPPSGCLGWSVPRNPGRTVLEGRGLTPGTEGPLGQAEGGREGEGVAPCCSLGPWVGGAYRAGLQARLTTPWLCLWVLGGRRPGLCGGPMPTCVVPVPPHSPAPVREAGFSMQRDWLGDLSSVPGRPTFSMRGRPVSVAADLSTAAAEATVDGGGQDGTGKRVRAHKTAFTGAARGPTGPALRRGVRPRTWATQSQHMCAAAEPTPCLIRRGPALRDTARGWPSREQGLLGAKCAPALLWAFLVIPAAAWAPAPRAPGAPRSGRSSRASRAGSEPGDLSRRRPASSSPPAFKKKKIIRKLLSDSNVLFY